MWTCYSPIVTLLSLTVCSRHYSLTWKARHAVSCLCVFSRYRQYPTVQGMVVHADVTTGQNCARNVQHDHVTTAGHTFTPGGKQRSELGIRGELVYM